MITEIFINSCILITFISISYFFIKSKDVSPKTSTILKVFIGTFSGSIGIVLMLFNISIIADVIVDFRYLPILLAAIFGGVVPPIIASIMIGIFRFLYFGVTFTSLVGLIDALLIGIGFSIISSTKALRKTKWIQSITYLLIVTSISMIILIRDSFVLFKILLAYSGAIILMSYFVFRYTEYLSESIKNDIKFKCEANVDFLTGLNNARQFKTDFNYFTQQTIRKKEHLSLLFLDIDFFKNVNDTYGHNSGDNLLKDLAIILRNTCRGFDIISRNGGEEFSVLLLDCSTPHAVQIAERIRRNIEVNEFNISDKISINITVSIGVTTYPDISLDIDNLVENADIALYEAKRTGRNKVCTYNFNKQLLVN